MEGKSAYPWCILALNSTDYIQTLSPAVHTCTLSELSLRERFERNSADCHDMRLAVDARYVFLRLHSMFTTHLYLSLWMNACQTVFYHKAHPLTGENPELRTLFHRLAHYLKYGIVLIFIFDGPGRPSMKRGKHVIPKPHWLTQGFQELITAFGYHIFTVRIFVAFLLVLNSFNMWWWW